MKRMLKKSIQDDVTEATVTLLKKGGQGILVRNNFILTAAHCIDFNCEGGMALGDYSIEEIETTKGRLKVTPYAVEPVSDIAVLGSLDDQTFYDEAAGFEEFCDKTKPLSLCLIKPKWADVIPVWIYTHKKRWVSGRAVNYDTKKYPSTIIIITDEDIKGGTSGSPIVNERGELFSIVSNAGGPTGIYRQGSAPILIFALPAWVYQEIIAVGPYALYHRITKKKGEEGHKRLQKEDRRKNGS